MLRCKKLKYEDKDTTYEYLLFNHLDIEEVFQKKMSSMWYQEKMKEDGISNLFYILSLIQ